MNDETAVPIPPGWHDDPEDATQVRYWDGAKWTEHRAPRATPDSNMSPPPPPASTSTSGSDEWPAKRVVAAGGAALVVLGSLMPWATINTAFGSISINGTDGDGVITLAAGIIIGVLVFLKKYLGSLLVSAAASCVLVYDFLDVSSNVAGESEFVSASVGWGLIVGTIAGIGATIASFMLVRDGRIDERKLPQL